MKSLKRVLIMAGGTGGHVFPGMAVARHLRALGIEVHWLGTPQGLESRLIPAENIPFHQISIQGLRGKGIATLLSAPVKITVAIKQSLSVMREVNPDVVIGMGGFVSGPGGIASWLSRRPLIIHEQNAKAGLTNKLLSRLSKRILEGFPDVFGRESKVIAVGNPVRQELEQLLSPADRFQLSATPLRLLILGGSLGAQRLNEIVPAALAQLNVNERPEIWHQTGEKNFESAKKAYEKLNINVKLTPFIENMAEAYTWANMVLCRAGASTVAELCTVGLGAILVPYPHAVDDHQTANADFMVKRKAALCIQQAELTESRLADIIRQFSASPDKRLAMAEAAYQWRNVNVAGKIYQIMCEAIHE